jgi:tRNA-Thr(GGU) m(6)t(6)A37 methyltransferase TsaA
MTYEMKPIGYVRTSAERLPRHWSISRVEGELVIEPEYAEGLRDVEAGQMIVVLFVFHRSPPFENSLLTQRPPHHGRLRGLFSICSPVRPNPIGLSVVEVTGVDANVVKVTGLDMYDGTPILDIKPYYQKQPGEEA